MTRLEREAHHYLPIGGRGYVYCGKSGAQHSVYSPPLSPSLDLTKGAHVEVQNVPILQQPDFRRVTMRYLSLVLAFTGCGDRFCQHQLYCTGLQRHPCGGACEVHKISKPKQAEAADTYRDEKNRGIFIHRHIIRSIRRAKRSHLYPFTRTRCGCSPLTA